MRIIWFWVYNIIFIPAIWIFFRIISLFNSKVREGFKGRRDLFDSLNKFLLLLPPGKKNIIIHSSSLGEYQQAIPLIDELLNKDYNIVLSFFSPSGYKNSSNLPSGVIKTYIPFDSYSKGEKFLNLIKPGIIIFMRYDLWYNLLYIAKEKKIKTVLANSRFDENDKTWYIPVASSFKKTLYGMIDKMFVIDNEDETNYKKVLERKPTEIIRVGDSKFERVFQSISKEDFETEILPEKITSAKRIFIMGSSWKDDEDVLFPALNKMFEMEKNLLILHVPHEPKETKIKAIEKRLKNDFENIKFIRLAEINKYSGENFIIVDRIGILSKLYSVSDVSYVGGGFRTGLHNILEPAIFNIPIFFSNKVKNSDEDEILLSTGCGILVKDSKQFYRELRKIFSDENYRNEIGSKCKFVFKDSMGIAKKIVNQII